MTPPREFHNLCSVFRSRFISDRQILGPRRVVNSRASQRAKGRSWASEGNNQGLRSESMTAAACARSYESLWGELMTTAGYELESSFNGINKRYRKALLAFFKRRGESQWDAEDLAQEVFLRLIPTMGSHDVRKRDAFIFQIATNLLRDRSRRRAARRESYHVSVDFRPQSDDPPSTQPPPVAIDELTPERIALSQEQVDQMLLALDELSERSRSIFLMFKLKGMKQKDIAEMLGISVSAVEKHIIKALCHLANRLC